jgi:hypothetical protein
MTSDSPRVFQIAQRIRSVARVWSVLVFILALILVIGTRFATPTNVQVRNSVDSLISFSLLISMIGLGVAWRWEGWGALINIVFYLAVVPLYWLLHREWIDLSIMVGLSPVILPGVLFAIAWYLSRHEEPRN